MNKNIENPQIADLLRKVANIVEIESVPKDRANQLILRIARALDIGLISTEKTTFLFNRISRLIASKPKDHSIVENLIDAFSEGQVSSKSWLIAKCSELDLELKTVFLCGGWYGTLFLNDELKFDKVRSFDIDPDCELIADDLHRELLMENWKFKASTMDIHKINYSQHTYSVIRKNGTVCELSDSPDTIINTSCEHIAEFDSWYQMIPKGKLLILQSNDGFQIKEHVNCTKNLSEFSLQTPMGNVLYSGEKQMPKFTRFMRIGYR